MRLIKFSALIWLLALIFPPPAHAYLDLGTGSYVVQIAIATLMGGAFFLKSYWSRLKNFFGKKRDDSPTKIS